MFQHYKPSMFNYICNLENGEQILFNSYKGVNNSRKLRAEKTEKIGLLLKSQEIEPNSDSDYLKLCELGFLVPIDSDEKKMRQVLYWNIISDNILRLVVHTTKACNFRCKYCSLDFDDTPMNEDTQTGIVNFIRKNIGKYRGVEISWFGGEPLMEPNVIENISKQVIDICEKAHKPYWGSMNTNGFYLTPEITDMLIKNKVLNLIVTIDGIKDEHDRVRVLIDGSPTFDHIINNLLYIKNTVKTRALSIAIRTNLTISMANHLDEYYCCFNQLFGDDSRFSLFMRVAGDWGGERVKAMSSNLLDTTKKNTFDKMFEKMSHLVSDTYNNKLYFPMNFTDINLGGSTCRARFMHKYTIAVDGNVTKCDDDDRLFSIGSLNKDGIIELNDNNYAAWLTAFPNNSSCDNCFFSCVCMMGTCPKSTLFKAKGHCPKLELDGLLKLYCATFSVPYLE